MITSFLNGWLGTLTMVAAGVILLVLGWRRTRPRREKEEALDGMAARVRVQRDSFPNFRAKVEAANTVWAAWIVGGTAANNILFANGKIRKLILAAPDNPELQAMSVASGADLGIVKTQIRDATRQAQKAGCDVRWWLGHLSNTFTIGNPSQPNTWVSLEAYLPILGADLRPGITFIDRANCDKYTALFLEMWAHRQSFNPS